VFSRSLLKWGFLACLAILAATAVVPIHWDYPLWITESLYFVEAGSAISAMAIGVALLATV
jgi:hypothetical protein